MIRRELAPSQETLSTPTLQHAIVLDAAKAKPSVAAETRPALTASARDGRMDTRSGRKKSLRRGSNKRKQVRFLDPHPAIRERLRREGWKLRASARQPRLPVLSCDGLLFPAIPHSQIRLHHRECPTASVGNFGWPKVSRMTRSQSATTSWLRVGDIARLTSLSRRYWQRRFARGDVPGARQINFGGRRLFIAERRIFEPWWSSQLHDVETSGPAKQPQQTALPRRQSMRNPVPAPPDRKAARPSNAISPSRQGAFTFVQSPPPCASEQNK